MYNEKGDDWKKLTRTEIEQTGKGREEMGGEEEEEEEETNSSYVPKVNNPHLIGGTYTMMEDVQNYKFRTMSVAR